MTVRADSEAAPDSTYVDVADVPTLETLAEQGIAYAYGPVIAPREPHLAWFEGVVMRGQVVPD